MAVGRAAGGDACLMRFSTFVFVSAISLMLLVPSLAFSEMQIRVRMIEASNSGSTIDPSLRDVHDELGSLFNFTSYRQLRDEQLSLTAQRPIDIATHRGITLEIFLLRQIKDMVELRVRIRREGKEILNTQVRLSQGRTVLIGGPKHGQGIIILAISARF